jgi:hypothetical protein
MQPYQVFLTAESFDHFFQLFGIGAAAHGEVGFAAAAAIKLGG